MKYLTLILTTFVFTLPAFTQNLTTANNDDTLRLVNLSQVEVFSKKINNKEDRIAFERLKYNTLKVYPYVKVAVEIYDEVKEDVYEKNKRRERKRYVNEKEKELRERFEQEIRELTRTQGDILIKLINRDTGNSCYEIVKDMKGRFIAFFWNLGGKFYDHNLKEEYNAEENADIELIIRMIGNGQLQVKAIQ